jgi:hypothetical protein
MHVTKKLCVSYIKYVVRYQFSLQLLIQQYMLIIIHGIWHETEPVRSRSRRYEHTVR